MPSLNFTTRPLHKVPSEGFVVPAVAMSKAAKQRCTHRYIEVLDGFNSHQKSQTPFGQGIPIVQPKICCQFLLRAVPPTPRRGKGTWLDRESPIVQPDLCIRSIAAHCLGQWTDTSDSGRLALLWACHMVYAIRDVFS